jgi:threonine dehydratase
MAAAFARLKLVVEPGGAAALAAVLFHGDEFEGDAVVCTASGGNVDPALFEAALARFGTGE